MYKIAEYLGAKIADALHYDDEQKAVITYGLLAIIQFFIVITLIIVFSAILGTVVASLILSFSVSILRVNAGGAHLSSIGICSLIGVIISVIMPTVFNMLNVNEIISPVMYLICNIILVLSLWVILLKAPVDTPNKPIVSETKRKRLKKRSITVVILYFAVVNLFIYFGFNIYAFCLIFGLTWQSFTMLRVGHTFLNFFELRLKK